MANRHQPLPRLFVEEGLEVNTRLVLDRARSHYLANVQRLSVGDRVALFNGRDGEWQARIAAGSRKVVTLEVEQRTRDQIFGPDLHYLFAPLKHARLDYMVQKAVEMGVGRLVPILTDRTQVTRINLDRMRANAIEAAEQCGLLSIPEIAFEEPLQRAVEWIEPARLLVFCDEEAPAADPLLALGARPRGPLALLVGPEGGFSETERRLLLARPNVVRLSLGPRIMRADTAAVAALALVQAVLGDWGSHPPVG